MPTYVIDLQHTDAEKFIEKDIEAFHKMKK